MRGKDLTGRRFGRLVAIKRISSDKKGVKWLCRCDCGNETTAYTNKLISGAKSSCGCLHREISKKNASMLAMFDKIDNTRVSYWKKDISIHAPTRGATAFKQIQLFSCFMSSILRTFQKQASNTSSIIRILLIIPFRKPVRRLGIFYVPSIFALFSSSG